MNRESATLQAPVNQLETVLADFKNSKKQGQALVYLLPVFWSEGRLGVCFFMSACPGFLLVVCFFIDACPSSMQLNKISNLNSIVETSTLNQ